MSTATLIVGDVHEALATLPPKSVDCVITSVPYFRQREYLPADHPLKALELGREATPGEYLEAFLDVMDALWPVMTDDATFWVNIGDKHWGSGGAGGDYILGGLRENQPGYGPLKGEGGPLDQSPCWLPHLFGACLAYGRNLLTGADHRQWVTRPAVTWCKPAPQPGKLTRTFRSATELIIYGGKHKAHYFDLEAVREDSPPENLRKTRAQDGQKLRKAAAAGENVAGMRRFTKRTVNPNGAPPRNWWVVGNGGGYDGEHFAPFPKELLIRPVLAGCPEGGLILDPFVGSGTTLVVATGHGRDALGIDIDESNVALVEQRCGLFLADVRYLDTDREHAS